MLDSKLSFRLMEMCALSALYSVLQAALSRLNACRQVCVSAIEMRQWRRSGRALLVLVVSTGVGGRWHSYGCRKLRIDQYANCCTIVSKLCNFTNHEKSRKISASVQCQARFNLTFQKQIFDMLVIQMFFVTMAWQYRNKVWPFFWPLKIRFRLFLALFRFLLKFSSVNPALMELHTKQFQIGMNSAVAAQFWVPQNAYRALEWWFLKKRFLTRCSISVIIRHVLVVAVIYLSQGYSTGGPWSYSKTKDITLQCRGSQPFYDLVTLGHPRIVSAYPSFRTTNLIESQVYSEE